MKLVQKVCAIERGVYLVVLWDTANDAAAPAAK